MSSELQHHSRSVVLEKGYINIYSELNSKEKRQLKFKRRYKSEVPSWDETQVYLSNKFSSLSENDLIVLDAGCGNGNYIIDENRSKISWAVGVDIDLEFTQKNICLDEIIITNLEILPFEENKFDMVCSLWVIEHLENPEKVFSEIYRVLKPGGKFLFATSNKNYVALKIIHIINSGNINNLINKVLFGRNEKDVFPTYYRANTPNELKTLSSKLGFKIKELRLNPDVSYTSFNELTYNFSKAFLKLPSFFKAFNHPHIVGVLEK